MSGPGPTLTAPNQAPCVCPLINASSSAPIARATPPAAPSLLPPPSLRCTVPAERLHSKLYPRHHCQKRHFELVNARAVNAGIRAAARGTNVGARGRRRGPKTGNRASLKAQRSRQPGILKQGFLKKSNQNNRDERQKRTMTPQNRPLHGDRDRCV